MLQCTTNWTLKFSTVRSISVCLYVPCSNWRNWNCNQYQNRSELSWNQLRIILLKKHSLTLCYERSWITHCTVIAHHFVGSSTLCGSVSGFVFGCVEEGRNWVEQNGRQQNGVEWESRQFTAEGDIWHCIAWHQQCTLQMALHYMAATVHRKNGTAMYGTNSAP